MLSTSALTMTQDSGANATNTITVAAQAGYRYYVTAYEVSLSGAAAGNDITITIADGATTIWKDIIGSAAARGTSKGQAFEFPLRCSVGNPIVVTIGAGGAGAITTGVVSYLFDSGPGVTTPAANTAQCLTADQNNAANDQTAAASAGMRYYVTGYTVAVSGGSIGASDVVVTIKDGNTVIWKDIIGAAAARGTAIRVPFGYGLKLTSGNALNFHVDASGTGGTVISANICYYSDYN